MEDAQCLKDLNSLIQTWKHNDISTIENHHQKEKEDWQEAMERCSYVSNISSKLENLRTENSNDDFRFYFDEIGKVTNEKIDSITIDLLQ